MIFITQRVARGDVFDADDRGDVARVTRLDLFAFVGLDLDQTRDAFALVRARIVNRVPFGKCAGINTEEYELADERIAPKFECESAERRVVIGRRFHRLMRVRLHPFGWGNIERTREV